MAIRNFGPNLVFKKRKRKCMYNYEQERKSHHIIVILHMQTPKMVIYLGKSKIVIGTKLWILSSWDFFQEMEKKKIMSTKPTDRPYFPRACYANTFVFVFVCLFLSFALWWDALACSTQVYRPHETHAMLASGGICSFFSFFPLPFTVLYSEI